MYLHAKMFLDTMPLKLACQMQSLLCAAENALRKELLSTRQPPS